MAERKKLAIIDGKSVFYRGYYAMPALSTKDGTPTGGVYGFAAMALELIKKLKPDYVCVAWDKPKTNIRSRLKLYPEYKAGRKPAPPDFYVQIPILHDLLKAFSWPLYELDDYEADDIMCGLAKKAAKKGIETMLITSDLDALQCIGPLTHVYALKKGFTNIEYFAPEEFVAKYGLQPEQFLDLKSLKGDSSDNIPGVPGIGEKTAVELLKSYKTLDGVYENLAMVKDSLRRKLEAGKDSAYLSKEIARLYDDAPIDLDLKAMDTKDLDVHALKALLASLEFRSLLKALPDHMQVKDEDGAVELHGLAMAAGEIKPLKVVKIDNKSSLANLKLTDDMIIHSLSAKPHGREPKVLILADSKTAYAIDVPKLDREALYSVLSTLKSVIGYDTKSSFKVLLELGLKKLPKVTHDVLVGAFLINSLRRERTLSELAFVDLGFEGSSMDDLPPEDLLERAGEVAAVVGALKNFQAESISELTDLIKLSDEVEYPVIPVIARMEYEGIGLDTKYLKKMGEDLEGKISDIEQTIYGHADQEFNIGSPSQLSDILFVKLNLPTNVSKKGKAGHYSTAVDVLIKLRDLHPIIGAIEQYREFTKLKSTYVDTLPKQVDENGRVHTTFDMTTAPTGRLSSNDPNLQNIPIRTELGKKIRVAFVARPGNVFIGADYSQFELRIAAALSKDEKMVKVFEHDEDIHVLTAAAILGLKPEQVTKDLRYRAKAVNFGIMYGLGPHALSESTDMTFGEAKDFIAKYFEFRPKLKEYIDSQREKALKKGFTETLLGRRRPTPDVKSSNFVVREAAYRQAVNMPLQGTAADLTKLAMVKVQEKLPADAHMLLQLHDSILVEVPAKEADRISKMMQETMESVYPELGVKLKVDIATGKTWGEI